MIGIFHHVIAITTIAEIDVPRHFRQFPPFLQTGTVSAISQTNRNNRTKSKREDRNEPGKQISRKPKPSWSSCRIVDGDDLHQLCDFGLQPSAGRSSQCIQQFPSANRCQLSCLTRSVGDRGPQLPLLPRSPPSPTITCAKPVSTGVSQWAYFQEPAIS